VRLVAEGTPGAQVALLRGTGRRSDRVPAGPCAGLATDLSGATLVGTVQTLPTNGRLRGPVPTVLDDCDAPLQMVDLDACTLSDVVLQGPARDYSQLGPFTVGNLALPVTARGGTALPTDVWFPSTDVGSQVRSYDARAYPSQTGEALLDVTPACDVPRPVLVHSHGSTSLPLEMFEVMEYLASHGWLVLAPEHVGNSWNDSTAFLTTMTRRRPRDVADTYSALLDAVADPTSPLFGCADPDAGYVVSGNSFGGYTAYAVGGALVNDPFSPTLDLGDPAATAVVTYVPWDAFFSLTSGPSAMTVPVLTFGADRDSTVGDVYRDLFAEVNSLPRSGIAFPDAGHLSFTPIWCVAPGNGCGPSFTDLDVTVGVAEQGTLAFLEDLRGRVGAWDQFPRGGPFQAMHIR
jgi:predicted dienelactone hydrolase